MQRPCPEPPDPLASAAAMAQTLEDLAALLRALRRRHARSRRDSSLTYRELATRTGWSQTAIAEYFTARTLPPTDRFDALLEVLSATPAERRTLATARDRIEEANRRTRSRRTAHPVPAAPVPGHPAPSARPAAAPRQLPAAPPMFTGRTRELAQLDAALDEQSRAGGTLVVSAIAGMGGIGMAICRTQGHSYLEADVLHHAAETHLAQRHPGQARDTWQQARELYTAQHRLTAARRVQQQLDTLDEAVISTA
jgi:transcriptional regulator with XRE-family HTH domain